MISEDILRQIIPQLVPALISYIKNAVPGVDAEQRGDYIAIKVPWDIIVSRIQEEFRKSGIDVGVDLYEDHLEIMIPVMDLTRLVSTGTSTSSSVRLKKVR